MGHGGDRGRGLNVDGNAMTKKMTDREMLQACLDAMEVSQSNGGLSDWKYMIAGLREHLQDEPLAEPAPHSVNHLLTVATDVDQWIARCSCGTWKTEVTNFGRTEDWPSDDLLRDFRTWHDRHVQLQVNRGAEHG